MYTKILNVQIIVSLLKQHGIKHLVLSAGTRHVPLAHSVENDDFFKCYSVVDERSAAYYALGLAKELGEPVAIACTSSTATCNYVPAIAEAFYQHVPLLVLTGDRDPYYLNQLEDQMIDQVDMYKNFCRKCVNLPIVNDEKDVWYCQRLVNEAILELDHNGKGPVQINFPINQSIDDIADASVPELPMYNKIERLSVESDEELWKAKAEELKNYKRIMVVCGSSTPLSDKLTQYMNEFFERYDCMFATEYLSNNHSKGALNVYLVAEAITGKVLQTICPDLVIFYGGNYLSRLKTMFRTIPKSFKSWIINDDGAIMDQYHNLTTVFQCSREYFFRFFAAENPSGENDLKLYSDFSALKEKIEKPSTEALYTKINGWTVADAKFKKLPEPSEAEIVGNDYLSSFMGMKGLADRIPDNSLLHLSILNSTRITQMFDMNDTIEVYSNLGTDGIDGSMSTFLGQSRIHNGECFLVIGDLSFFYDMNSVGIRNIGRNVHILLVNNGGGAEFYFSMGPSKLPNIDMHISAAHHKRAKEWVEANGFKYMCAHNLTEYEACIDEFMGNDNDRPVVLELFTDKLKDIKVLKGFRRYIHQDTPAVATAKTVANLPGVKQALDTKVGHSIKDKIKKVLNK